MKKITCVVCGGTKFIKEHDKFICCDCGVEYSLDDVKNMLSQEKEPQVDTQTVNEPETLTTKEVVTENVVSSFGIKKEREDTLVDGDKKEREEKKSNFSQREKVNKVHVHNFDNENLEEDENNEDEDVVPNQYSSNNNVSLQGTLNVALDEPKQATEILKKDKQQKKVSAGTLTIIILFAIFAAISGILILLSISSKLS